MCYSKYLQIYKKLCNPTNIFPKSCAFTRVINIFYYYNYGFIIFITNFVPNLDLKWQEIRNRYQHLKMLQ